MDTTKVAVYENACKYDPFAQIANQHTLNAVQLTDKDVKDSEANVRYAVKDAEADIRHDVLFEGQENQKTSLEVEARLKDRMTIDRNAYDAQFMHLGEKICTTEKEVIKSGYEARLEALKTADRITDKLEHKFEKLEGRINHVYEELSEEIESCCCDSKLVAANNTGLLNQLVKSLIK